MLSAQKYGKNLHVNYSPFGAILYGRNWSSEKYRYGFNGMEKDDEVSGEGNSYTAEFWQYSSRLAVRWNIDPVDKPWESSYCVLSRNPILMIDPNGDDDYFDEKGNYLFSTSNGNKIKLVKGLSRQEGILRNGVCLDSTILLET